MTDLKKILGTLPAATCFFRGENGYEDARRDVVWHAGIPERFPDVIVHAYNETGVVAAVRGARDADLKIGIRSGGRSWTANHLRDGGMLIDVSRMREFTVDPAAMKATAQPGLWAADLVRGLVQQDLFFPGGHCVGVAVGGYLLQGGYGWSGRAYGPACASVEAIDVVTADGELVRADDTQNSDLLWAARGAGTGFFGVVTRFHLRVYPKPRVMALGSYRYPIDVLPEVFGWAQEIGTRMAPGLEFHSIVIRNDAGIPEIVVFAPMFASTREEAANALAILETCPVLDRAVSASPNAPATLEQFLGFLPTAEWAKFRWFGDNIWTHTPMQELLPGIQEMVATLPEPPGYLYWMTWGRNTSGPPLIDMAFDLQDDAYMSVFSAGTDPSEDEARAAWVTRSMRSVEHLSSGTQLADENLRRRPAKFKSEEHMARLDEIRIARDPNGRFHSWMGRLQPRMKLT